MNPRSMRPRDTTVPPWRLRDSSATCRQYDGLGGSDESYDAPDFQNMFLAWTTSQPAGVRYCLQRLPTESRHDLRRTTLGTMVLPSFHRPDLINYWANRTQFNQSPGSVTSSTLGQATLPALPLLRKIMLRPNWHDHPNFDGSNPEYARRCEAIHNRKAPSDSCA